MSTVQLGIFFFALPMSSGENMANYFEFSCISEAVKNAPELGFAKVSPEGEKWMSKMPRTIYAIFAMQIRTSSNKPMSQGGKMQIWKLIRMKEEADFTC